jgi:hypothetical protein
VLYFQVWKKLDKDYIHGVLLELSYLIVLVLLTFLFLSLMNITLLKANETTPALESFYNYALETGDFPNLETEIGEEFLGATEEIKSFLIKSVIMSIVYLILLMLNSCLFKSLIWSRIHKIKFNRLYFFKFAKLNLIWLFSWLVLFIITTKLFVTNIAAGLLIIELFLFIYLTNTWRIMFNMKDKNWLITKMAFKKGFRYIYLALLPCFAIIGTYIVFNFIIYPVLWLSNAVFSLLYFVGLICIFCFSRLYFKEIVKGFK